MSLSKLKSLDLSYNNLASVPPDTTANLTRLRALDLSYNDLTAVPVVIQKGNIFFMFCSLNKGKYYFIDFN